MPSRFIFLSEDMLEACVKTVPDDIKNAIRNDPEYAPVFEE